MRRRFRRRQAPSLLDQAADGVAQVGDALGDVFRRKVAEGQAQVALASAFGEEEITGQAGDAALLGGSDHLAGQKRRRQGQPDEEPAPWMSPGDARGRGVGQGSQSRVTAGVVDSPQAGRCAVLAGYTQEERTGFSSLVHPKRGKLRSTSSSARINRAFWDWSPTVMRRKWGRS